MTDEEKRNLSICILGQLTLLIEDTREYFPEVSDGEIYDAVAQEIERRRAGRSFPRKSQVESAG